MKKVFVIWCLCASALFVGNSFAGIINPDNVTYTYGTTHLPSYYCCTPDEGGDHLANGYRNGIDNGLYLYDTDWVAFTDGGALMTFDLGGTYNLDSVEVTYMLIPSWGIPAPVSMDVSFSNDGVNFTTPVNMTGFYTDPAAYMAVNQGFSLAGNAARYVKILVNASQPNTYEFLGEFLFSGAQVPEPTTMLLLGIAGLGILRRKN